MIPACRSRRRNIVMLAILILFLGPILARAALYAIGDEPRSWRDADWSSTGLLPKANSDAQARVIVFTGTAGAWKGVFAVHSWIVLKRTNATAWTRYDVVGWGEPVRTNNWPPDGRWFGNVPVAIADISGADAEKLIPRIRRQSPTIVSHAVATTASGPAQTATVSSPQSCARCPNSLSAFRRTLSAAIFAKVFTPA